MNVLCGGLFGAALTASGIYRPSVILSQFQFTNWHMVQTFLTATASSALIITAADRANYATIKPRNYTTVGWFAPYDGNILGGLLLGVGMALSSACPGSVLLQVAFGMRTGYYALQGAILAGIVWAGFLQPYLERRRSRLPAQQQQQQAPTADAVLGISQPLALAGFEALLAAVVAGSVLFTPPSPAARISPVTGGLLVGVAQLISILLRKSPLQVSSSYVEVGEWFWRCAKAGSGSSSSSSSGKKPSISSMEFSVGIAGGSWLAAAFFPFLVQGAEADVSPVLAFSGGFVMLLGSRIAGGCTSGHGISGVSTLALSSIITIASAFIGGAAVARFLL